MKIEIELDDLSTSAIQDIIDAMEPDRAGAAKDLNSAEAITRENLNILRNSKHLSDEDYRKAEEDAYESIEIERQYRVIYERISRPMERMQQELAERNGELER